MYILFLVGVVFIFTGFGVHKLRWYFLISGYNTMSKEKKENVDVETIAKIIGSYSYINGALFFLTGILMTADINITSYSLIFFAISTIAMLFMIKKYDFNTSTSNPQKIVSGSLTALVVVLVGILLIYSSRPANVSFLEEGFKIHGMYGSVIPYHAITELELKDDLPVIERRTNGSAVGSHLRGNFRTREYGQVKLFIDTKKPPFIYFRNDGTVILINLENAEKTKDTYDQLLNHLN